MPSPRRQNGFSRPYSSAQISAWIALAATVIQFLLFVSPLLPIAASIPVTIVFMALVVAVLYYGGKTQLVNPMDVHLARHVGETNNSTTTALPEEDMKHCWICDVQVAQHSMHCKYCNKCVYHFDHHCMWLNTCVGSANYQLFFRTMLFIFAMELSHLVIQLVLLIDSFTGGATSDRVKDWLGTSSSSSSSNLEPMIHAVLIFFIIFSGISVIMIGQLLWFHVGLQRENISTYEYIVRDHKKKREQMKLAEELQSHRVAAVAKATREGQSMLAHKLQVGGYCRDMGCAACDPLEMPKPPDPEDGFAAALGGAPVPSSPATSTDAAAPMPVGSDEEEQGTAGTGVGGGGTEQQNEAAAAASNPQFVKVALDDEKRPNNGNDSSSPSSSNGATTTTMNGTPQPQMNGNSSSTQQAPPSPRSPQTTPRKKASPGPERFI